MPVFPTELMVISSFIPVDCLYSCVQLVNYVKEKHQVILFYSSIDLLFFIGHALDILARIPLWKDGLDYRHGTGHGIGSYLNVHEGKQ